MSRQPRLRHGSIIATVVGRVNLGYARRLVGPLTEADDATPGGQHQRHGQHLDHRGGQAAGTNRRTWVGLSHLGSYDRGENGSTSRRNELRRAGEARIAADEAKAVQQIQMAAIQFNCPIISGALTSHQARRLIGSMPTAQRFMPEVKLEELEAALPLLAQPRRSPYDY